MGRRRRRERQDREERRHRDEVRARSELNENLVSTISLMEVTLERLERTRITTDEIVVHLWRRTIEQEATNIEATQLLLNLFEELSDRLDADRGERRTVLELVSHLQREVGAGTPQKPRVTGGSVFALEELLEEDVQASDDRVMAEPRWTAAASMSRGPRVAD